MKRLIICSVCFALLCCVGFAEEFSNGISSGGFWNWEGDFGGGYGEISFPILKNRNNFMLRNNLTFGGFGGASKNNNLMTGGASAGDKFIFGGIYDESDAFAVKSYGLAGLEISMFGAENHPFFSPSVMLGVSVGGGFEFQYAENNSFVVEFGGKYRNVIGKDMALYEEFNDTNPFVTLGFRSYFENRN